MLRRTLNWGNELFEARYIGVDVDKLRIALKKAGGTRVVKEKVIFSIDYKVDRNTYAKVIDRHTSVGILVKHYQEQARFPKTIDVSLKDNLDTGIRFIESLGMQRIFGHERLDEKWNIGTCVISIESVPALPTYAKIECLSPEQIVATARDLDLENVPTHYGNFLSLYKQLYGISKKALREARDVKVTFANVEKILGIHVTQNAEKFRAVTQRQQRLMPKVEKEEVPMMMKEIRSQKQSDVVKKLSAMQRSAGKPFIDVTPEEENDQE